MADVDNHLQKILDVIQEDVGNRGLRTDPDSNLVTAFPGDFAAACRHIAGASSPAIGIVTGFFIPTGNPATGETDGPLGAVFLARAFVSLGMKVVLLTDDFCILALEAGLAVSRLRKQVPLVPLPGREQLESLSAEAYWDLVAERTGPLTHLIALERVGPSHTPESIRAQLSDGESTLARFLQDVPEEHRDRCQTMRGRDITPNMSPAHLLFDSEARQSSGVTTIGIGDGGNEIGMGKIPWDTIARNIPRGGLVACRTPTDHLIVCGVSNWGAYGLAAGVRRLKGARPDPELFSTEQERELLRAMVENGPLVDGVSGEPTVSVDGLSFERYAEILQRLGEMET